jgi:hypothetical protein
MAFDFGKFGNLINQGNQAPTKSAGFDFGNFAQIAENRIRQRQMEEEARQREEAERKQARLQAAQEAVQRSLQEYEDTQSKGVTGFLNRINRFFGRGTTPPVLAQETPEYSRYRQGAEEEQKINQQAVREAVRPMNLLGAIKTGAEEATFGTAKLISDAVEATHYQLWGKKTIDEINKQNLKNKQDFLKAVAKAKNLSPETKSRIIKNVQDASDIVKASDIYEFANKDEKQIMGEAIGTLADFLTFNTASLGLKTALSKGGITGMAKFLASKEGVKFIAEQALSGLAQFGLGGLGTGLEQKKEGKELAGEIVKSGATGAIMQPVFEVGGGILGNLLKKYKGKKLFGEVASEVKERLGKLSKEETTQLQSHLAEGVDKETAIKHLEAERSLAMPESEKALDNVSQTLQGGGKIKKLVDNVEKARKEYIEAVERRKSLLRDRRAMIKDFIESDEGGKVVQQAMDERIRKESIEPLGETEKHVLQGIKNNRYFRKEKSLKDSMGSGWLMEKNGRYVIADGGDEMKSYIARGWDRKIEIDSLATEAGFERGEDYLNDILRRGKIIQARRPEKIAHEILLERDPLYKELNDKISNLREIASGKRLTAAQEELVQARKSHLSSKKSITAQKLNEVMPDDYKLDEFYDPITIKGNLEEAANEIELDKSEALRKAFDRNEKVDKRIARMAEFAQIARNNNNFEAVNALYTSINKTGTETAQGMNMMKALYLTNPEYKFMESVVNARLGNFKVGTSEVTKASTLQKAKARLKVISDEIRETTRRAFKITDAQQILDNLICK